MAKKVKREPWKVLEPFKGQYFEGEWPTLPQLFKITVSRYPENLCFKQFTPKVLEFTYKQALEEVEKLARVLKHQGIEKGDKVAVCGKNSVEWAISYLAITFANATVVPIDVMLSAKEIENLMNFANCKAFLADKDKLNKVETKENMFKLSFDLNDDNYILKAQDHKEIVLEDKLSEQDLAAILFTSGTTGVPKGVMLTHKNFVSDCFLAQANLSIRSEDVFYAILPLHHSYSMLAVFIESISAGSTLIFGKKLIISQIFKEMREGKVTMFLGVPMIFNKLITGLMSGIKEKSKLAYVFVRLLMRISGRIKKVTGKNPGHKMFGKLLKNIALDTNRICICGGGPLPSSTFKMFNELGIDFVQGYGLTETSPILTLNPIEDYIETSVGKVLPGIEMKIVNKDENGNGEIHVRGPMVMKGYYENKEATDEILTEDGWLNTGDVGYLDKKNYLYLTGRKRNLIVTEGGKNVFPEEIEDHFQLFDEVEQLCVLGYLLNNETKAEGIRVIIKPSDKFVEQMTDKHGDNAKEKVEQRINEIVEIVNKELLVYKRMTKVLVVDEPLEMTTTKKIKRFSVAKKYSNV